jgi:transposase-like protein
MITTNSSDRLLEVGSPSIPSVSVTVDSKGRVRASKEQRRVILEEFERSGMSGAQFAKRTGLKYSTLAGWLQRYRRGKSRRRHQPVRLLEAVVEAANDLDGKSSTVLVLELPGGARLEIGDVNQVPLAAALLRSLPC